MELVQIAKKVLVRPQGLEKRFRKELEDLEGPEKWVVVKEIAHMTLNQLEWTGFSAHVQKAVVDG